MKELLSGCVILGPATAPAPCQSADSSAHCSISMQLPGKAEPMARVQVPAPASGRPGWSSSFRATTWPDPTGHYSHLWSELVSFCLTVCPFLSVILLSNKQNLL